jgi:hypothetical protein
MGSVKLSNHPTHGDSTGGKDLHIYIPSELSGDGGETDLEAQEHHPVRAVIMKPTDL